jgi:hypothetical protein
MGVVVVVCEGELALRPSGGWERVEVVVVFCVLKMGLRPSGGWERLMEVVVVVLCVLKVGLRPSGGWLMEVGVGNVDGTGCCGV